MTAKAARQEWIDDLDRFAELREPWNRLAGESPFLTWEWLDAWWRCFGTGDPQVFVAWEGEELVAGLACGLQKRHLRAMADMNTDLFGPVVRSEADLRHVVDAVLAGPWSRMTFPSLPLDQPFIEELTVGLRSHGWLTHHPSRLIQSPIVDTSGSFEDYCRDVLSTNARRQVRKAHRRLEREGRVELRVFEEPEDLEPVLAECFALEAAGHKGLWKSDTLSSEALTRFLELVFGRFKERGAVRVSELRLDDALIAFDLSFIHGRVFYAIKTSYAEDYSYYAPGHILRLAVIEACFERELDSHEFLYPVSRWKARYMTEARTTTTLRSYRRRPAALSRYAARRWVMPALIPLRVWLREVLRRFRQRRPHLGSR
jgi:CelD/BcsL family acetyltransferase involved in cellulose biosynthesis